MSVKSTLTNCVLMNKENEKYLFGEVVRDVRFSKGHHIRTTPLVSWDAIKKEGTTMSGTVYSVEKLYVDFDEYSKYLRGTSEDTDYIENLLFWAKRGR